MKKRGFSTDDYWLRTISCIL